MTKIESSSMKENRSARELIWKGREDTGCSITFCGYKKEIFLIKLRVFCQGFERNEV